jgi:hypothetical protein
LFCSQSGWISDGCGYSRKSSYLLDVSPHLNFVAVGTHFLAWTLQKGISIVVFSALTVLGSEIVLLLALNSASGLSLEIVKTHTQGTAKLLYLGNCLE